MKRLILLLLLSGLLLTGCRCELSPQVLGNESFFLYNAGDVIAQGRMDELSSEKLFLLQSIINRIVVEGRPTIVTYAPQLLVVSEGWTLNFQKNILILNLRRRRTSWIQLYCPIEQNERTFISHIKEIAIGVQ